MKNKPKTINSLMGYMREKKGIDIKGSNDKRKLRYMGYFHGYKGYRYHNSPNPSNMYEFNSFTEIQAIYDYDMSLKAMFYPEIMFLETSLKNFALEEVLKAAENKRFAEVYSKLLVNYKAFSVGSRDYKNAINKRMNLRNKIYGLISRDYGKRKVVSHYYDKDQPVPIWAIFELMSLGEFGTFIECLDEKVRKNISKSIGIKSNFDNDGQMPQAIVFTLKDLRNAVAHNNTVFDTRFKTGEVNKRISKYMTIETGIQNIKFNNIADYVLLICFIMKHLKCPKIKMLNILKTFENSNELLRSNVPVSIYNTIIYTDARSKIDKMRKYVKS